MSNYRFIRLDALRGFMAVGVVAFHSNLAPLFPWFWIAMDIFFVMSGFLITKTILDLNSRKKGALDFFVYRVTRLFPVLILSLSAIEIFIFLLNQGLFFEKWSNKIDSGFSIFYILMIQNLDLLFSSEQIFPRGVGIEHFWSLILEEQYYLLFGFLFFTFYIKKSQKFSHLIGITLLILTFSVFFRYSDGHWWTLPGRIDGFAIGTLLGLVIFSKEINDQISVKAKNILKITGLLSLTITVGLSISSYWQWYQVHIINTNRALDVLLASTSAALIIYLIYKKDISHPPKNRLLKVFAFVGVISFEIYVIHYPILLILTVLSNTFFGFHPASDFSVTDPYGYIMFTLILSISLPLAFFMNKFLTKPALASRERVINYLRR